MRWSYGLVVGSLLAVACSQQPPTSPTELARPQQPAFPVLGSGSASNLGFGAFEDEDPEDQGLCARSGGFWCQNQDGQNPNLTNEKWETYLGDAVALLAGEGVETSEAEVAEGVCDVRRQLFRQLAALALNLAAGFVDPMEPLTGEDAALGTVGDAFARGAEVYDLGDEASFDERQAIKDTMDRINGNESLANECTPDDEPPGDDEPEDPENDDPPDDGVSDLPAECEPWVSGGQVTVCHYPPGNPSARHTITIGIPAWPAHEGHGDSCGPCGT